MREEQSHAVCPARQVYDWAHFIGFPKYLPVLLINEWREKNYSEEKRPFVKSAVIYGLGLSAFREEMLVFVLFVYLSR